MRIEELDYDLPPGRIATAPADPRDSARLMVIHRNENRIDHRRVRDLPSLSDGLRSGDLLVFNQTKVLPALWLAIRRATGGKVRGLYLSSSDQQWRVMLESGGSLRPREIIQLDQDSSLELTEQLGGGEWLSNLHSPLDTPSLLDRIGTTPLPPYIRRKKNLRQPEIQPGDAERYNTVFARDPGSVAAPTAGLHFTPGLLNELQKCGIGRANVTLHVGTGTFAPVRTERVEDHPIHSEWIHIPVETLAALREARDRGNRIIPVGTTTVRALESLPENWRNMQNFSTDTRLFILPRSEPGRPGPGSSPDFSFRFTDGLMTNFHLPRSTLLALVAALPGVGIDSLKRWYHIAIDKSYHFYSYGDAMLLL